MEYANGKELKIMATSLILPKETHGKHGNPNLTWYIGRARAIVQEVRSFERITYLVVEQSLRLKHKKLIRRERERKEMEG